MTLRIPPEKLIYYQWPVHRNAITRYRINRSLGCLSILMISLVNTVIAWQKIQLALGKINKVDPFIIPLTLIPLFLILPIFLVHHYLHSRYR
jgi:hypothetical protein